MMFKFKGSTRADVVSQTTEVGFTEEELNLYAPPEWHTFRQTMGGMTTKTNKINYPKLIKTWRQMSEMAEVEDAIEEITNEAVVMDDERDIIDITFTEDDKNKLSEEDKKKIELEWGRVKKLLSINRKLDELFRQAYIDGALYLENVYYLDDLKKGIIKLNLLAPHHMEIFYDQDGRRYFKYTPVADNKATAAYRREDSYILDDNLVTFVSMGYWNIDKTVPLSFLNRSVRVANQLRMMEDALVIYRMVRAPERRAFYIDVGKMPKAKAEQHIQNLANKYRNTKIYNTSTGEIETAKLTLAAVEDFWLPRREGKGTEIETLQGGQALGETDDIVYFLKKLYKTLKVPSGRLSAESIFVGSRTTEITREELRFYKFIQKLRRMFNIVFIDIIKKNLIITGKMSQHDWNKVEDFITFDWASDNRFSEMTKLEVMTERMNVVSSADGYLGRYFSRQYIMMELLNFTEEDIKEMDEQIEQEISDGWIEGASPDDEDGGGFDEPEFKSDKPPPGQQPQEIEPTPISPPPKEPEKKAGGNQGG